MVLEISSKQLTVDSTEYILNQTEPKLFVLSLRFRLTEISVIVLFEIGSVLVRSVNRKLTEISVNLLTALLYLYRV